MDTVASGIVSQVANVGKSSGNAAMIDSGVVPAFQEGETFNNLINGNVVFDDAAGISPVNSMRRDVTPGEGIVNSIQSVRDQFLKIQGNLEALTTKGQDFSSADLFQMQYDVMQLSYINEISSKTADKTSQGAQTLFRNQG